MKKQKFQTFNDFISWEKISQDTIDFKMIYVDLAEDLIAGLLLSQIIYWFLPNRDGSNKVRVRKNGQLWLSKARHEWWDEIRISPKQVDRAKRILQKKGLIIIDRFRFNNATPDHFRINEEVFLRRLQEVAEKKVNGELQNPYAKTERKESSTSTKGKNQILPKGKNPSLPKGKIQVDQRVKSLTETTSETTPEITTENTLLSSAANAAPEGCGFLTKAPFKFDQWKIKALINATDGDIEQIINTANWWIEGYHKKRRGGDPFALIYRAIKDGWDLTDESSYLEWGTGKTYGFES